MSHINKQAENKTAFNSSYTKSYKRWTAFSWFLFGLILFAGLGYATTIRDTGTSEIESLNNISYVDAGVASDIQVKINQCPSNGCTIIIPPGTYSLDTTINISSALNLIIEKGATLRWNTGATPSTFTDQQATTYNAMIYGNQLTGVNIYNYGAITPTAIYNPTGGDTITHINGSTRIDIYGGRITSTNDAYGIFNSELVKVHDTYSNEVSTVVWQECTNNSLIYNIMGVAMNTNEGEAIDMNGYSENVIINNVNWIGGSNADDQTVDINANRNVLISNVLASGAYRPLTTSTAAGIRFGTCSSIVGRNVVATNVACTDCNQSSQIGSLNSTVMQTNNVQEGIYGIQGRLLIGDLNATDLDKINELEVNAGSNAEFFIYSTGGANPSNAAQISFGEGSDTATHWFRLNGATNNLEVSSSGVTGNTHMIFPRDNQITIFSDNRTAATCSTSTAGGVYWDNSTKRHYGCNSTAWNALY